MANSSKTVLGLQKSLNSVSFEVRWQPIIAIGGSLATRLHVRSIAPGLKTGSSFHSPPLGRSKGLMACPTFSALTYNSKPPRFSYGKPLKT